MSACQKNILTRSFFLSAILFESTLLDRAVATIQPCPPVSDSTAHDRESPEDVALHPRLFFPKLCSLIDRARSSSAAVEANLAEELASSPLSSTYRSPDFAEFPATNMLRTSRRAAENGPSVRDPDPIPIVMAHGLGDSCFNRGLQKLANLTSSQTGRATWCVPQGDTRNRDVIASFLVSMDDTVDAFAEQVRSDPRTADGFDAIGFSQGCNIVRGYIAKYNDPPVRTFMSVNGVNAGVAALPNCSPRGPGKIGSACEAIAEATGSLAYNKFVQSFLFPANYYRDPELLESHGYRQYSQIARWSNEGYANNGTLNENFARTDKFVWVLATRDTVVFPREGEHWGALDPDAEDPFTAKALDMKSTSWYENDSFGLRAADEAGKFHFESFPGNHLGFSTEDYARWIDAYF